MDEEFDEADDDDFEFKEWDSKGKLTKWIHRDMDEK